MAQAEHDPEALAIFITTSRDLAESVARCSVMKCAGRIRWPRSRITAHGAIFVVEFAETDAASGQIEIAPEHLTVDRGRHWLRVHNAGSVFLGDYSAQAAGDYMSGPNHVLPTGGAWRDCAAGLACWIL